MVFCKQQHRHPVTLSPCHLVILLFFFLAACRIDDPLALPAATAYPAATAVSLPTATPVPYPAAGRPETSAVPVRTIASPAQLTRHVYLPFVVNQQALLETAVITPTPLPIPTSAPTPTITPIPTVDFTAVQADLRAQGQELSYVKIGFHVGVGGNSRGLEDWMRQLDAAGVPFFLKSVDNAQPILLAQELMRAGGVPHVLVYRKTAGDDYDWDVPNYDAPPEVAAEIHWQMHRDAFPPELDPSLVWIETINEVDKNQSEWLAEFALATANMAIRDGFNWAAFGWASGEPEPEQWQGPAMTEFLRFAGNHPDRVAIALHEYSYLQDDIGDAYPYKVGRFQELLRIVDNQQIPRPTILITEWGWTYERVPEPEQALADVAWAARLYGRYPSVKGAAIWYLGSGFDQIANRAQKLIEPVTQYTLQHYFAHSQQQLPVDVEGNRP
ncbi:MAG: hypothetical protein KC419_18555 [Anaerolineales bacterium]|nr:hypothetical protein [Anaerolineales bacterium]